MASQAVDLDLFINAMSKGTADGSRSPSLLGAFMEGTLTGIKEQQAWETEEQQQEIRANQIEQLPVANRIQEANAVQAEAQVAAYKANPQQFTDLQLQKQENALAQARQQEDLMMRRTELIDIIKGPDEQAKTQAYTSGQFSDVFAQEPELRKQIELQTPSFKDKTLRDSIFDAKYQELRAQNQAKRKVEAEQSLLETFPKYERSANIGQLERDVGNAFPDAPVNRTDLVLYGEVRTEKLYPQVKKVTPGPNGQPITTWEDDLSKEPKLVRNFYYGKGAEKKKIRDVDSDTFKEYEGFRSDYWTVYDLDPNSGGLTDLQKQSKLNDDRRAAQEARDRAQAAEDAKKQGQDAADFHNAGIKPTPPPVQRPKMASAMQATPTPTPTPAGTAAPVAPTPVPTAKARQTTPGWVPSSGGPEMAALQGNPAAQTKVRELKERGAARSAKVLEKYGMQPSATPTPQQEAALFTPAKFMPDTMTPVVSTNFRPSDEVISRVESIPEVRNSPAIVKAIIAVESAGRSNAVSPTGVRGIAQMEQRTGENLVGPHFDRSNVSHNVLGATLMFEVAMRNPTLRENPVLAIAAYNGGEPVIANAVRLAGTTDWNVVKEFIPEAVQNNPKLKKIKGKSDEIIQYVDKVVSYFPGFAQSAGDYRLAQKLKSTGLLDFEEQSNVSPFNGAPLRTS